MEYLIIFCLKVSASSLSLDTSLAILDLLITRMEQEMQQHLKHQLKVPNLNIKALILYSKPTLLVFQNQLLQLNRNSIAE